MKLGEIALVRFPFTNLAAAKKRPALVLARTNDFVSDYVGHMPAAKDFGRLRMYSLRPREEERAFSASS